ncbi:MAG: ATP-binding protein [Anaerolineales bacterium]
MKETLTFTNASLGPIKANKEAPVEIDVRPLTVFIGVQGSGKSLASQLLYFLRNAPYLISQYANELKDPTEVTRKVVDGLRSGRLTGRDLSTFVSAGTAQIHYTQENGKGSSKALKRSISINSSMHTIAPIKNFGKEIDSILAKRYENPSGQIPSNAMFIPAERTFFSRFLNSELRLFSSDALPFTMLEFSNILTRGREMYVEWQKNKAETPKEVTDIDEIVGNALRGQIRYEKAGPYSGTWQWLPQGGDRPIQIEMASSGQMEAWPLIFAAETAFGLPDSERPQFLHIEEPEAHLHPSAQVAMVHLLAYLVNKGFRVLVTTHSLTVLYALNNLMAAYQMLPDKTYPDVPAENVRLNPDDLSAYLFTGDGVEEVSYPMDGLRQIEEGRLGEVLGDLQVGFNRILAYATYEGNEKDASHSA